MNEELEEERILKIRAFMTEHPEAEFGPAHVVVSDYNVEDDFIQSAIEYIDNFNQNDYSEYQSPELLRATRGMLLELLG